MEMPTCFADLLPVLPKMLWKPDILLKHDSIFQLSSPSHIKLFYLLLLLCYFSSDLSDGDPLSLLYYRNTLMSMRA
jgi:hypothetical protein